MSSTEPRGWSLQRRLALRLVLGIGLLLGGLFVALDVMVDRSVYWRLDQFLVERAEALADRIARQGDERLHELQPAYELAGQTEFFAFYDAEGRVRLVSANSGGHPVRPATDADEASPRFQDVALPDGRRGRTVTLRLPAGDRLVLGIERESWDHTERAMHGVLLGGILLAIALAVLLCLWLLRSAFASMREEGERLARLEPGADADFPDARLPRELKPYADAVRDALRRLLAAAERERRFSRNIAHEVRTPLAEMRASAEHALASGDPERLREGLFAVLEANARMSRGMQALLALTRYESGQVAPAPDPLDLAALLRLQAHSLAQTDGFDPDSRLAFDLPDALWVHSDVGMLERILANLLHNAHEYGDAGSPVRVALRRNDDGWQIRIANAARGVGPGDLARFGERYWRGEGAGIGTHHAGLGVALSVAMANALGLRLSHALEGAEVVATLGDFKAL